MVRPVEYQYRVNFRGVDTAERPGILVVAERRDGHRRRVRDLAAGRGLYFLDDIQIGAAAAVGPLSAGRCRGAVRRSGERHPAGRDVPAQQGQARGDLEAVPARSALLNDYEVKVTYLALDRSDVVVDWTTTDQERLIIRDPHR